MYLTLSPAATNAIFELRHGSYCSLKIFSTNGGPSFGPERRLSTHRYFFLCPPPRPPYTFLPLERNYQFKKSFFSIANEMLPVVGSLPANFMSCSFFTVYSSGNFTNHLLPMFLHPGSVKYPSLFMQRICWSWGCVLFVRLSVGNLTDIHCDNVRRLLVTHSLEKEFNNCCIILIQKFRLKSI